MCLKIEIFFYIYIFGEIFKVGSRYSVTTQEEDNKLKTCS